MTAVSPDVANDILSRLAPTVEPLTMFRKVQLFYRVELNGSLYSGPPEPVRLVRPLFCANSVMIVSLTNAICMNVVMIATIMQASYSPSSII